MRAKTNEAGTLQPLSRKNRLNFPSGSDEPEISSTKLLTVRMGRCKNGPSSGGFFSGRTLKIEVAISTCLHPAIEFTLGCQCWDEYRCTIIRDNKRLQSAKKLSLDNMEQPWTARNNLGTTLDSPEQPWNNLGTMCSNSS
jgi:hypothetical protein